MSSDKEKRHAVVEIFGPTIQGEGPLAGSKTMFIRFGGCDYRCKKCDSLHAVIPDAVKANSRYLTPEEIVDELVAKRGESNCPWVTLSGGNPLMHKLDRLVSLLHGAKFAVAVETQGTIWHPWVRQCQMIVISPKSPGMGEKFEPEKLKTFISQTNLNRAPNTEPVPIALKVVVFSQQDIDFALEVQQTVEQVGPASGIHPGLMFLSLGNPFPPVLDETNHLENNPELRIRDIGGILEPSHADRLLEHYRIMVEDFVADPRIPFWKFLPQLHVLLYSNEAER